MDAVFNLTSADIPSLKQFIAHHFHDRYILLNDSFFNWQYRDNPFSFYPEYSMKIIKHHDQVLGYCGMVPVEMNVGGNTVIAGAFANLLVDPRVRNFGLGVLLVKEVLKEYPLAYISGYSDELRKVCLQMPGWSELGTLTRAVVVVDDKAMNAFISGPWPTYTQKPVAGKLQRVSAFGNEIEGLWERVKSHYPITIRRSPAYLKWRYESHPLLPYLCFEYIVSGVVAGYGVVRVEHFEYKGKKYSVGRIIDVLADEVHQTDLLRVLSAELQTQGVLFVDFFYTGDRMSSHVREAGFSDGSAHHYDEIPLLFSPVDFRRSSINLISYSQENDIQQFSQDQYNWYVTKGDGDQDRPNVPPGVNE